MEANDRAAVERVLAGDRDAFRVLVDRHSHAIFRLAFRMARNDHDAEDIVQETFLRAYRALHKFESRANFGTWLYRVAVNCAIDHARQRQRRPDDMHSEGRAEDDESDLLNSLPSAGPTPDKLLLSGELRMKVEGAMAELSSRERAAFVMRHYDGCSIEEISNVLRLRRGATKNTVFRAVQKLRQALQGMVNS